MLAKAFILMICTIAIIVFFNPIVMYFWALISPKTAAAVLDFNTKWNSAFYEVYEELWNAFTHFYRFLPWRSKKEFFRLNREGMTVAQELRLFSEDEDLEYLSPEALDALWEKLTPEQHLQVALQKRCTDEHLQVLLAKGETEALEAVYNGPTPSNARLLMLIESLQKAQDEAIKHSLEKVLKEYVSLNGLPSSLVSKVYALEDHKLVALLEEAIAIFDERAMVIEGKRNKFAWRKFVARMRERKLDVSSEAQILMNLDEYEVYHEVGLTLSEEAVKHFLCKADNDLAMAIKVIQYDFLPKLDSWEDTTEIQMIVGGNPKLFLPMARMQLDAEASKN